MKIAIKEVKLDPNGDNDHNSVLVTFKNEIDQLKKLSHKRIVTFLGSVHDTEKYTESVCLEFDLIGDSLFALLKKGALDLIKKYH